MKCPGQDRGYWTGDRVFDLPCPKCGFAVEFFRDEGARRCAHCGYAFSNARIALDCASWCDQAEACLGLSRSRVKNLAEADTALSGRLIKALEEELPQDSARFVRALLVFQHAKELVPAVGGNPRVVLAAALVLEIGYPPADSPAVRGESGGVEQPTDGCVSPFQQVQQVLSKANLEADTIQSVYALLDRFREGHDDTPELAVLHDACRLATLASEGIAGEFRTEAGAARAKALFQR